MLNAMKMHRAFRERVAERRKMVLEQIASKKRGVQDPNVIRAMETVPRHAFVPSRAQSEAYEDYPLSIGYDVTISQPYIVAFMTEALQLKSFDRVLEIGTGSGYQAAVLAEIAREVYTVEVIGGLVKRAKATCDELGYENIHFLEGDGHKGWKEMAPYDAIIVTAAPATVPEDLLNQLKIGGRLVIPVGTSSQYLYVFTRTEEGFSKKSILGVRFVPLVPGDDVK
eukprot:m.103564 g.103564  ORF g.103564 m.103564 type:complete len:225 (+) comp9097_c0_seq1:656-1330(+)